MILRQLTRVVRLHPIRLKRFQSNFTPPSYFQPPPQRPRSRLVWRTVRGLAYVTTAFLLGQWSGQVATDAVLEYYGYEIAIVDGDKVLFKDGRPVNELFNNVSVEELVNISRASPLPPQLTNVVLCAGQGFHVRSETITHVNTLASNTPNEDCIMVAAMDLGPSDWGLWGVLDGHAGAQLSNMLRTVLPTRIYLALLQYFQDNNRRTATPETIAKILETVFLEADDELMREANSACRDAIAGLDPLRAMAATLADQGSCATVVCHDQQNSLVHVANIGDSRAVLGRWSQEEQRYVARALTTEHTGYNQNELARLEAEHPDETVVDKATGRVHGIAVTRAFGDSRFKLPESVTYGLHQTYFANPPRPNGVIKTPPYLTARPDITHFEVQLGSKPDFLIVASDGLWDQLSNDQAVGLVQTWLDKQEPIDIVKSRAGESMSEAHMLEDYDGDMGLYYDEASGTTKWQNHEKYFTNTDGNCATHLIRNALGGKRSRLLSTLVGLPASRSRAVRDDVTVMVTFFGADTSDLDLEQLTGPMPR